MPLLEHDEVRADSDRVGQDVADGRRVLDVLTQLLELRGRRVRRADPALRADLGEPRPRPAQPQEPVEVEVALDLVAQFLDLDAPGRRVVRVAHGIAEGERLEHELDRIRTGVRAEAGLTNVEFREGLLESLPVETGWADVVISNGVLNLVPDKAAALAEMHRVLRPGGRLQAADIVLQRSVSSTSKQDVSLWTGCIAGGLLAEELVGLVAAAGFVDVELVRGGDVFAGAPQASSAAEFGTTGAGIRARR